MLKFIKDISDPLLDYIKDDPVRPEIPKEFRVTQSRFVATLVESTPQAMVCVCLKNNVPESVADLDGDCLDPTTAVFYTVWSYTAGAGTKLIFDTVTAIKEQYPTVTRFVTLSPKTNMAFRFHTKNGATMLRENPETINYEYQVLI